MDKDARFWAMLLHLSVFASYAAPLAGLIVPILIWQLQKESYPSIDDHGKEVANFVLSLYIYTIAAGLLCLVFIGIPLLFILAAVGVAFPIIGAIKANNGELWHYPAMIRIF